MPQQCFPLCCKEFTETPLYLFLKFNIKFPLQHIFFVIITQFTVIPKHLFIKIIRRCRGSACAFFV